MLNSLLWAINRPQQAVFQGSKAGSEAFERLLGHGQNVIDEKWHPLVALGAAGLSVPSAIAGAVEGLTGQGEDVRGRDLTRGLVGDSEFAQTTEEALGNVLDLTASPGDLVAPVGRLANVPIKAARQIAKMAPTYQRQVAKLGTPVDRIGRLLKQKRLSLDPADYLGKYGYKYLNAPAVESFDDPLVIQGRTPSMWDTLHEIAGEALPGDIGGFSKRFSPSGTILSTRSGKRAGGIAGHEEWHRSISPITRPLQGDMGRAQRIAQSLGTTPSGVQQKFKDMWRVSPQDIRSDIMQKYPGQNDTVKLMEEALARVTHDPHYTRTLAPIIQSNFPQVGPMLGKARKRGVGWVKDYKKQTTPWQKFADVGPTVPLNTMRRLGSMAWEDRDDIW